MKEEKGLCLLNLIGLVIVLTEQKAPAVRKKSQSLRSRKDGGAGSTPCMTDHMSDTCDEVRALFETTAAIPTALELGAGWGRADKKG